MAATESSTFDKKTSTSTYPLIDTHTHFDTPVFDNDRAWQVQSAYSQGIRHLILVGYLYQYFERMYDTEHVLNKVLNEKALQSSASDIHCEGEPYIHTHIALGLHPFYIEQHTDEHLIALAQMVTERRPLAIGEIGLDTFTDAMKAPNVFARQKRFFEAQLDIAVTHQLPVMLHIRKAHAEALAILKAHDYDAHELGGIAHSFSGGEQEAKAFVKLGFKLGITGQITNPNAKKLRRAITAVVEKYGIACLVIETDCPDMTPIMCQTSHDEHSESGQSPYNEREETHTHDRNVPANLPWVLISLSELLDVSRDKLAKQLWQNSCDALKVTWTYPA